MKNVETHMIDLMNYKVNFYLLIYHNTKKARIVIKKNNYSWSIPVNYNAALRCNETIKR